MADNKELEDAIEKTVYALAEWTIHSEETIRSNIVSLIEHAQLETERANSSEAAFKTLDGMLEKSEKGCDRRDKEITQLQADLKKQLEIHLLNEKSLYKEIRPLKAKVKELEKKNSDLRTDYHKCIEGLPT